MSYNIYVKGREKVYYYIIELTLLFLIKNGLQQIPTVEGCIFFNYFFVILENLCNFAPRKGTPRVDVSININKALLLFRV